ncbi:unnamed protein product, partial [Amoebophrya sp. A25]
KSLVDRRCYSSAVSSSPCPEKMKFSLKIHLLVVPVLYSTTLVDFYGWGSRTTRRGPLSTSTSTFFVSAFPPRVRIVSSDLPGCCDALAGEVDDEAVVAMPWRESLEQVTLWDLRRAIAQSPCCENASYEVYRPDAHFSRIRGGPLFTAGVPMREHPMPRDAVDSQVRPFNTIEEVTNGRVFGPALLELGLAAWGTDDEHNATMGWNIGETRPQAGGTEVITTERRGAVEGPVNGVAVEHNNDNNLLQSLRTATRERWNVTARQMLQMNRRSRTADHVEQPARIRLTRWPFYPRAAEFLGALAVMERDMERSIDDASIDDARLESCDHSDDGPLKPEQRKRQETQDETPQH